ncbi:MAG: hypothetical protein IRY99_13480 [Isosphaeraceae bacterium]|nr:hypothetical protein [Isosphaeraceae bacterium]
MSSVPPLPSDEVFANPYAAPRADLVATGPELPGDLAAAEAIRREHINHEASVKSVGSLFFLGAFFLGVASVFLLLMAAGVIKSANNVEQAQGFRIGTGIVGVFYLALTTLYTAVGIGLHRLQPWARWTTVVLMSLGLLGVALNTLLLVLANVLVAAFALVIGGGITGYILYLMVASKSAVVFSPEYKAIIAKTPHIRYRTSKLVIALVLIVVVLIVLAFAGAFLSR